YVNAQWEKLSHLTLENSLGQGWLCAVFEEDRHAVSIAWRDAKAEDKSLSTECRLKENVWVHLRATPILSQSKPGGSYVFTVEDVTERRAAIEWQRQARQA